MKKVAISKNTTFLSVVPRPPPSYKRQKSRVGGLGTGITQISFSIICHFRNVIVQANNTSDYVKWLSYYASFHEGLLIVLLQLREFSSC